jgi:hypothetical protein
VSGNPLKWSDLLGLVKWQGVQSQISGFNGFGGTVSVFTLTSDCISGIRVIANVFASGIGPGFGGELKSGSGGVELEDYLSYPDPSIFNGFYSQQFAGISVFGSIGIGWVILGNAHSVHVPGIEFGVEPGLRLAGAAYVVVGASATVTSETVSCCKTKSFEALVSLRE